MNNGVGMVDELNPAAGDVLSRYPHPPRFVDGCAAEMLAHSGNSDPGH